MKKEDLQHAKIYFISYGPQTQLVIRFEILDIPNINYTTGIHYWNGYEKYYRRGHSANYCVTSGIEELREATLPEKHALIKFELENGCI